MQDPFVCSLEYVFIALLGGITRALIQAKSFCELRKFGILKIIVLSPIAGYIYYQMVTEWNAPNHVVTFFFAYSFVDIVDRLAKILTEKWKKAMGGG